MVLGSEGVIMPSRNVKVNYPDSNSFVYFCVDSNSQLFIINSKWNSDTGIFYHSRMALARNDVFEVVEILQDKSEVWVELVKR